jgi:guanylate kinase
MSTVSTTARGILFVVSAPSGGGKTTLCRRLLADYPKIHLSISTTTRPPRGTERNGVEYIFVDRSAFEAQIERGAFVEWAEVHGNLYGTSKEVILEATHHGRDVLFDIDYQGGRSLKTQFPDAVMILVVPPSMEVLEARLRGRGTDSPEVVARRLAKAREELSHYHLYDYLIINDDLDRAYELLRTVYRAAHQRRDQLEAHVERLLGRR